MQFKGFDQETKKFKKASARCNLWEKKYKLLTLEQFIRLIRWPLGGFTGLTRVLISSSDSTKLQDMLLRKNLRYLVVGNLHLP